MKFWQAITWAETDQLCAIARHAEELGFDGLMGADHALYPQEMAPDYPYSPTGRPPQTADSEYPDMWTSCAAMAAVTTRLRFTCGVYVLPLRNPVEVAKLAATLANLSQGRFVLGVGSGWMKEEFDVYGVDFKSRGRRMDEMLEVMEGLWSGKMFEHHGEHFDFPAIQLSPEPAYPIPIFFGGAAPIALRRTAAKGNGWIGAGNSPEEVPGLMRKLAELRREAGRDHLPFETLVGIYARPDLDLFQRMEGTGMTSGLNAPFTYVLGPRSKIDEKKRFMDEFAESVIRHFED